MARLLPALALALASSVPFLPRTADAGAPVESAVSSPVSLPLQQLDGSPMAAAALQGKVVLFVNVASMCGLTPQYKGLEALYDEKKSDGLVIVGVPCNQFGGQEPGAPAEIASFCQMNYGVSFPLLAKQDVNGAKRSPLYASLVGSAAGGGGDISWNFEKFLVGRDGKVVARFAPTTKPDDQKLRAAIDAALAAK
jgi:glutathione peroxidase-family protein